MLAGSEVTCCLGQTHEDEVALPAPLSRAPESGAFPLQTWQAPTLDRGERWHLSDEGRKAENNLAAATVTAGVPGARRGGRGSCVSAGSLPSLHLFSTGRSGVVPRDPEDSLPVDPQQGQQAVLWE